MLLPPKKQHGYRNHLCVSIHEGSEHYEISLQMVEAGLLKPGQKINNGTMQYFHATVKGCQAIGLSKAAIKRAMEP
jgi:hypothetical protein